MSTLHLSWANHCSSCRYLALGGVLTAALLSACARSKPQAEERVSSPAVADKEVSQPRIETPPPRLDDVKDAVRRVFKDASVIDDERKPNFVHGDFNGDSSADVAVILKPASAKLSQMNQEFPPWILKNPLSGDRSGGTSLRIEENDRLVAVIHGYGPHGWRDPQATQTFLLKNAAGSNMEIQKREEFLKANQGKRLPRLRGDLIREVLNGKSGYLYYAEATYLWYDPDTFKGEPERRVAHPGIPVRLTK